jgi:NAD-dependent DNA ligase
MGSSENPLISVYRNGAIADRQIDELIGIVKGVMADGMVTHGEVEFLLRWMEANRQAANLWPAKALYPRLAEVAAKGFMNLQEEGEMLELLMKTVGGNTAPQQGFASNTSKLPLTEPARPIAFDGRSFCFTGAFHAGTRDWCHGQVESRGGKSAGSITKKLDYLVIGDIGNENWAHSTHGRKIEKALEYIGTGCGIAIVSEEHWYSHL